VKAGAENLEYEQAVSVVTELCDRLRYQKDATLDEIKAEGERIEKQMQEKYQVLVPLTPRFTRALEVRREAQMNRDATVIAAAIYSFRYFNNRWPETIDDALTSFEPKPICRDYYGHGFVYRIVENAPLLYAVGPNGVDDGGRGSRYESDADTNAAGDDVLFLVGEPK
jgi:hypothetical protein